jgi:hypothetical protein
MDGWREGGREGGRAGGKGGVRATEREEREEVSDVSVHACINAYIHISVCMSARFSMYIYLSALCLLEELLKTIAYILQSNQGSNTRFLTELAQGHHAAYLKTINSALAGEESFVLNEHLCCNMYHFLKYIDTTCVAELRGNPATNHLAKMGIDKLLQVRRIIDQNN